MDTPQARFTLRSTLRLLSSPYAHPCHEREGRRLGDFTIQRERDSREGPAIIIPRITQASHLIQGQPLRTHLITEGRGPGLVVPEGLGGSTSLDFCASR